VGSCQVVAVCTEIGRGHPHYLSCVWQKLCERLGPEQRQWLSVFDVSHGLARAGWRTLDSVYRNGVRNSLNVALYNSLRRQEPGALAIKVLGRDLRRRLTGFKGICLVEHQLTARMLRDVCRVWFVHGDVAAPPECTVNGVEWVFVPLESTERRFAGRGCPGTGIVRTGLMIEPELAESARPDFDSRMARLSGARPLTIGFFSSGAFPAEHVARIRLGVVSVLEQGMRAIVFCGDNRKFLESLVRTTHHMKKTVVTDDGTPGSKGSVPDLLLVARLARETGTQAMIPLVRMMDAFVAPAHERTQWALGLGLPMFTLFPMIGTHARMNYDVGLQNGVVHPVVTLEQAQVLGRSVAELRKNGALAAMAGNGFGQYEIRGPERIAEEVLASLRNGGGPSGTPQPAGQS
jgi:hypothetical protein